MKCAVGRPRRAARGYRITTDIRRATVFLNWTVRKGKLALSGLDSVIIMIKAERACAVSFHSI